MSAKDREQIPINSIGAGNENADVDDDPQSPECDCSGKAILNFFIKPELTVKTLYGVILGFSLGLALGGLHMPKFWKTLLSYPGELFINALKMVVIPMIICDMILAVIKLGDINKIRRIGKRALTYYLCTTFIACIEGLIMVSIFEPGVKRGRASGCGNTNSSSELFSSVCMVDSMPCYPVKQLKGTEDAFFDLGRTLIPPNIAVAFVDFNILGLIFFVMLYAFYVAKEEKCGVVKDFFECSDNAFMSIIKGIIWWTPLGIFSLIIGTVLDEEDFFGLITSLGEFIGCTFCGILLHLLVTYPIIYFVTTRNNPYRLLPKMTQPMMTAFATSSSAATLPVTIQTAERNGVHKDISKFMIPLGATINMDGTAIYFPIAVIYLANAMCIELTFGKKVAVSMVSAMVSVGAAPIPSAGLVYLILIMNAVGLPASASISYVLSIDWLLDRAQTACNVTGDGFGACILEHYRQKDVKNGIENNNDVNDEILGKKKLNNEGRQSFEEH